ncbi:MAG TPA: iron chelate uptake ABC transporter family permease subunit, partial [Acidimicrobiales bacterium]|nr:iron chelate uptake ABC transporter family permease subunit [Acidimicrobiales bacterium]
MTVITRRAPDCTLMLRSVRLGVSARLAVRPLVVTSVLVAVALVVFAWSLAVGEFPIPFGDVVATLVGQGRPDTDFVVGTLRLPRGLAAVLVGAAFGLSGAIFQRIARNPLASPDIIGITAGAAACAVLTIVVLDGTANQVTIGALGGGTVAAIAIYLLSYRRGVTGYRLVLVGIGITAMLTSATS